MALLPYGSYFHGLVDAISAGLGIIMLGMGMTLSVQDFAEVLQNQLVLGAFLQFSIMPTWAALMHFCLSYPVRWRMV